MNGGRYHILLVTTNSALGGGELSLVSLASSLNRDRFYCSVICPPGPLVGRLRANGIDVCAMRPEILGFTGGVVPNLPWRTLWSAFKYAKGRGVDIVHCQHYEACKVFGLVARGLRIPCLWTCHGFWYYITGVKGRYLAAVLDHIVAVSQFAKRRLLAGGALREKQVSVIHNWVDDRFISEPATSGQSFRHQFGISSSDIVIGLVARLIPLKGHENFLRAFKQVVAEIPNVKAVLVGSEILGNPSERYTIQIQHLTAELGLTREVIFAGFQENMPGVYDACDMVVLSSKGETFPLVPLEAMARRKPVIATDCGGPSEIIGESQYGLLVPVDNVNCLAEAILRLAKDEHFRRQLAESGYQRVTEVFTTEKMVSRYESLYLQLLERSAI